MIKLPERRLRLVFFGTPDIASTMLAGLLDAGEDDVVLVVCQPDRPKGRGKKVIPPPVKALAESRGIEVLQPKKLKDGALAKRIRDEEIDLGIVVAYGRILPKDLFEAPAFDTWNVHASLLPKHRGASPIQHAILTGDEVTGVTLMQLSEGMDEGPMLLEAKIPLDGTETGGSLFDKLATLGAQTLVEGIRLAKNESLERVPQNEAEATYAPMLKKQDGELDFTEDRDALLRKIRAFDPWPGTFVRTADGQPLKITRAKAAGGIGPAGVVLVAGPSLVVAAKGGAIEIETLQPSGKRPMSAADYLNGAGRGLKPGARFPDP